MICLVCGYMGPASPLYIKEKEKRCPKCHCLLSSEFRNLEEKKE